jgi:8-oxo-dGTP pyrophosphatase MutT (NUDIX family)
MNLNSALQTGDAVAAVLLTADGRYVLQLRDDVPHIWYPAHWGLFGGAVERGEDEIQALCRELHEELELALDPARPRLVTRFDFDLRPLGLAKCFRSYYELTIDDSELRELKLHEGSQVRAFEREEALALKLVPYDAFALYLHHHRSRLAGDPAVAR